MKKVSKFYAVLIGKMHLLSLLTLLISFVSCSVNYDSKIIGSWGIKYVKGESFNDAGTLVDSHLDYPKSTDDDYLVLEFDAEMNYYAYLPNDESSNYFGQYSLVGNKLTLKSGIYDIGVFDLKILNDQMTLYATWTSTDNGETIKETTVFIKL